MYEKRKNGAKCVRGIKKININLNKIQRSNERVSQDKNLIKGIMVVLKTKGPQIRCIPRGSFGLFQCKSSSKKTCLLTKSLERHK